VKRISAPVLPLCSYCQHNMGCVLCNAYYFTGPYHPGGINVLLGDGSVRSVKSTVNGLTWRALGTVSGGEVVSSDAY
jgi:prepilin-type processing-associated H-X9-DG protein